MGSINFSRGLVNTVGRSSDQATEPTQSAEPAKPVVDESVNLKLVADIEREAKLMRSKSSERRLIRKIFINV